MFTEKDILLSTEIMAECRKSIPITDTFSFSDIFIMKYLARLENEIKDLKSRLDADGK